MTTPHERNVSRRSFMAGSMTAVASLGVKNTWAGEPAVSGGRDWSGVRGFNYQPSYGSTGLDLWQKFDAPVIERELGLGKKYFPRMNAIRLWLSWDSFLRDPKKFAGNFDKALAIAAKFELVVMPVLFNRWHNWHLDYGGIYVDHLLPNASWFKESKTFDAFVETVASGHKDDPRIFAWDLCNEPYSYNFSPQSVLPQIVEWETAWLRGLYDKCKALGVKAPITVGIHPATSPKTVNGMSDVLSIHPYYDHNRSNKEAYQKQLGAEVGFAQKVGKPILATECCGGGPDDESRVESIRYTLAQLKRRGVGWLVYLLHHSLIADAHRPQFGPNGGASSLAFIEADGSLRPGHEVFNEF